jgi:succinate dehydrogenase / fumarate reductase iron-sulfur subunit
MNGIFDMFRKRHGEPETYRQTFGVKLSTGMTLLDVFHSIQQNQAPSFSYRYSCRGAICGSCAVRINGVAALACKTQAISLAQNGPVKVDPLGNMPTIKDLVADQGVFWEAYEKVRPAIERANETHDETFVWDDALPRQQADQLSRSIDCIKCAACFSDCPKRAEDPQFTGPQAGVQLYKFYFDPRDSIKAVRAKFAKTPAGVVGCDSHSNCVKVCPKDVRPLRAINFIKRDLDAS